MLKTQNVKSSRKQCLLSVLLQLYATTCENMLKDFANTVKRMTVSLVPTCHCEHIIPRKTSGKNALENLAWTCPRCNNHKHAKTHATDCTQDSASRCLTHV